MGIQQSCSQPLRVIGAGRTFELDVRNTPSTSKRDPRIDVLRGLALFMIFVDHIPDNLLGFITLRNFGFSDAAEVFVLLAGFSSMLAYGRIFQRDGARSGLRRIALRLARLYLFQIGLLLTTFAVALIWTTHFQLQPTILRPIREAPVAGLAHALTLHAVPAYLDILPLYIVLLAAFPLVYVGLRTKPWLALGVSAAMWLAANLARDFNLPNWMDGQNWFFDPFAWQFLFTVGAALAMLSAAHDGALPRVTWLAWLCAGYLMFAFVQSAPWVAWHLPNLQPFAMSPPDKTHLGILRLLDMLALAYLVFSSGRMRAFAGCRWLQPLEACGRHSLEVFAAGCVVALFGRLLFRITAPTLEMQIAINAVGMATMCLVAWWLERRRHRPVGQNPGRAAFYERRRLMAPRMRSCPRSLRLSTMTVTHNERRHVQGAEYEPQAVSHWRLCPGRDGRWRRCGRSGHAVSLCPNC
jgi:hypothetical protein